MPTTRICRLGWPLNSAARWASARRASATVIHGTSDMCSGGPLRHDRRSPGRDRLLREVGPVHLQTAERHEYRPRCRTPRVVRHAGAGLLQASMARRERTIVERHHAVSRRGATDRRSWRLDTRHHDRRDDGPSVSTTLTAESSGVPGAGNWSTTRPPPRNSAVHPNVASSTKRFARAQAGQVGDLGRGGRRRPSAARATEAAMTGPDVAS